MPVQIKYTGFNYDSVFYIKSDNAMSDESKSTQDLVKLDMKVWKNNMR